jgi:hypothetical protein
MVPTGPQPTVPLTPCPLKKFDTSSSDALSLSRLFAVTLTLTGNGFLPTPIPKGPQTDTRSNYLNTVDPTRYKPVCMPNNTIEAPSGVALVNQTLPH